METTGVYSVFDAKKLVDELMGRVFPERFRKSPELGKMFETLVILLQRDEVAEAIVAHDRDMVNTRPFMYKQSTFGTKRATKEEIKKAKIHLSEGLLQNLPSMIFFNWNIDEKTYG